MNYEFPLFLVPDHLFQLRCGSGTAAKNQRCSLPTGASCVPETFEPPVGIQQTMQIHGFLLKMIQKWSIFPIDLRFFWRVFHVPWRDGQSIGISHQESLMGWPYLSIHLIGAVISRLFWLCNMVKICQTRHDVKNINISSELPSQKISYSVYFGDGNRRALEFWSVAR